VDTEAAPQGRKLKNVTLPKAFYLGGLPGTKAARNGLVVTNDGFGIGVFSAKKAVVRWDDMAGISFDSATARKSRAGKAVVFGVLAVAAKSSQSTAEITVNLKDGNVAIYELKGTSGPKVRAKLQPFLAAHEVRCLDDGPLPTEVAPAPTSAADEIAKLVALRDSGAITDEEFTACKASLLP
jgi:hypothetical protein